MKPSDSPIKGVRWTGRAAIVDIAGDIDLHRSQAFQRALLEILDDKPERVVVNLAEVPYMDSSGVASLVKLLARVRREKVDLKLAGLTPRVRSVFEITRLDSVFEIFGSAEEALGS